ncbi:Gfo/Idh/MocA family oxidoreductase [Streptomyces olivaceus]|uniref:Gfo/Idh/MocA family oxidoreductase n=1 Tax=Streptomyces olivaceus TaxID=47716 RepID=A0ABS7VXX1_STROV|nr:MULTISPECIES: Gfo/Idh/MocA family oxidoreductase [Streptomyces]MBZ6087719.1 Gfo/Idh/MocA family oxidoreductase [Streptomyces olivaceus]MBZ6095445.1 Gfo/Idh/MocA family oxidoreductase [Streptomyces olivaceus]MBZ6115857.1 Gfo/Idh/MocA family oxidoreductase [Streptomyces olivaceus]MBZ6150563.1 Gfo/Idh/MocA family oxidoreductase [Streptomyces olivaceus]MBZ6297852.1 Gfo/Idh/MocA family oxidoreductase [Streptomyces olivaceus]
MSATASGPAPFRVLVCGTNFGRFYAEAARRRPGHALAGILSRGSAASREHARSLGVPHYTDVGDLPEDIDAACVAVSSSISGGQGTELARALMDRGIHVLQEHPVHLTELTQNLTHARRRGVQYRLNTHYPHVAPVRAFIDAARRLVARQRPLFVDAATPVHLMHPLVDILGQALGTLRPWRFADPAPLPDAVGPQPFRSLQGVFAGVPLTLRVHHQLDPSDRDNHALHWHRISLGTEGGVLTLADTHGPVLWSPRLHIGRDADRRFVLDGPGTGRLGLATTSVVGETVPFRTVFSDLWPEAVGSALDGLREAAEQGGDALRAGQYDLAVCRIWTDLAARLGPPEIVRPATPRPLAVSDMFPARAPVPARTEGEAQGWTEAPVRTEGQARARTEAPVQTEGRAQGRAQGRTEAPAPAHVRDRPAVPDAPTARAEHASYTPSAEFFDLVAAEHTATASAPAIAALLADADLSAGPVVDVGAGTGLVTEAVAKARPDAEIVACEPAVGMRAVLTSRVFSDPDLRSRVTVTADAAPGLDLPDRVGAVLLCGVLGHLDADARALLWRRLTRRLAPGGLVVVELMGFDEPLDLPETRLATATAGRQRYEWSFRGAPDDAGGAADGVMRLHSTWRVYREDTAQAVREVHDSYRWAPFGLKDVEAESGMTARTLPTRPGAPPLAVLTLPAAPSGTPVTPPTTEDHR